MLLVEAIPKIVAKQRGHLIFIIIAIRTFTIATKRTIKYSKYIDF